MGLGQALTGLFAVSARQHNDTQAAGYAFESLAVTRRVGDRLGMAIALHNLGELAARAGQHREAAGHFRAALDIYSTIEVDPARVNNTRQRLALSLEALGEPALGR